MNVKAPKEEEGIPGEAIEAFARFFYKEASSYGFGMVDYIRFVNQLLDVSMHNSGSPGNPLDEVEARDARPTNDTYRPAFCNLPIEGERIKITSLNFDHHRELINTWLSDKHGRQYLISRVTSRGSNFDELSSSESNIFGLISLSDDTPVGSVAFLDHDPMQGKAELRKLIGEPQMRGKGLAKEAIRLWIQYGIEGLGLKKIYLNTLDTNIRNIKLNKELGFKFEGILRNELFFDNSYHDVLRMGFLVQ